MNIQALEEIGLLILGFSAQALFGLRILIQWWSAEKTKSLSPPASFWYVSLAASFLFLLYGVLRHDWVIIVGQVVTYFIYVRNIQHLNQWNDVNIVNRILLFATPIILVAFAIVQKSADQEQGVHFLNGMTIVGFIGQGLLNARFIYQWIHLENNKRTNLSKWFWLLSIGGAVLLLLYGFNHPTRQLDPVLILSQCFGLVVYLRNLFIIRKLQPAT